MKAKKPPKITVVKGLHSLADEELDNYHDPERRGVYWGIDEALTWVFWRDQQLVDYVGEGRETRPLLWQSFASPESVPVTVEGRLIAVVGNKAELLDALRYNRITALGLRNPDADRERIKPETWFDLDIVVPPDDFVSVVSRNTDRLAWQMLMFRISDMKDIFPPRGKRASKRKQIPEDTTLEVKMRAAVQEELLRQNEPAYSRKLRTRIFEQLCSENKDWKLSSLRRVTQDLFPKPPSSDGKDKGPKNSK